MDKGNVKKVFVFKTSIQHLSELEKIKILDEVEDIIDWSADLEDCDNILRVVARDMESGDIIRIMEKLGFYCEELTYS